MIEKYIRYKIWYLDILKGYSSSIHDKFGPIYIRHADNFTSADEDKYYIDALERAQKDGVPNEEKSLDFLSHEGLWTKEQNDELKQQKVLVENLKRTKAKLHLPSQVDQIKDEITKQIARLITLEQEKISLLGMTAEVFARRRLNEIHMFKALFKDESLSRPLFSWEEFDDLGQDKVNGLVDNYNERLSDFTETNLKKVTLCPFFMNVFCLCNDSLYDFYGKPAIRLTYYQSQLYSYGRYFKHLLSECKDTIPEDIMEDPDKIIDFYDAKKNAEKQMEKNGGKGNAPKDAFGWVGATAEDYKKMGTPLDSLPNWEDLAKQKGGSLGLQDIMKAQGI